MSGYSIRAQRRRWPKMLLVLLVVAALGVTGAVIGVRRYYEQSLQPVNSAQADAITITIPSGSTVDDIGEILKNNDLIRSEWAFKSYINRVGAGSQLKAGTYELRRSYSVQEIVEILTDGAVKSDLVHILPEKRVDQIKESLIKKGFDEDEVTAALEPDQYKDHPALVDKPEDASLEGYLYPESFHITADTKATEVIRASLDEMHKRLTPDIRNGITERGLTVYEGIILASIVEREVPETENRPVVAQVFLKRLSIGMMLQSNATDEISEILGQQYNTYQIPGLPPAPISNVTETSLRAVAFPADTDWLYFVSGEDCVTRFGMTQAEHEAHIQAHGVRKLSTQCN